MKPDHWASRNKMIRNENQQTHEIDFPATLCPLMFVFKSPFSSTLLHLEYDADLEDNGHDEDDT